MGIFDILFNKKDKKPTKETFTTHTMQPSKPASPKRYMTYMGKHMEVIEESVINTTSQGRKTHKGTLYRGTCQQKCYMLKYQEGSSINYHSVETSVPGFIPADLTYAKAIINDLLPNNDISQLIQKNAEWYLSCQKLMDKANRLLKQQAYDEAMDIYNAMDDYIPATYKLAQCYAHGHADDEAAYKLYRNGANYNYAPCVVEAAKCLKNGRGVEQDADMATLLVMDNLSCQPNNRTLFNCLNELVTDSGYNAYTSVRELFNSNETNKMPKEDFDLSILLRLSFLLGEPAKARKYALEGIRHQMHNDACLIMACIEASKNKTYAMRYLLDSLAANETQYIPMYAYELALLHGWITGKQGYPKIEPDVRDMAIKLMGISASYGLTIDDSYCIFYLSEYFSLIGDHQNQALFADIATHHSIYSGLQL